MNDYTIIGLIAFAVALVIFLITLFKSRKKDKTYSGGGGSTGGGGNNSEGGRDDTEDKELDEV